MKIQDQRPSANATSLSPSNRMVTLLDQNSNMKKIQSKTRRILNDHKRSTITSEGAADKKLSNANRAYWPRKSYTGLWKGGTTQ